NPVFGQDLLRFLVAAEIDDVVRLQHDVEGLFQAAHQLHVRHRIPGVQAAIAQVFKSVLRADAERLYEHRLELCFTHYKPKMRDRSATFTRASTSRVSTISCASRASRSRSSTSWSVTT